jgi:biopolymer transport protein ExbD
MRQPGLSHRPRGGLELPMTPMIDVIFLLIIFFICTSSFQPPEEVLPTNLSFPGAVGAEAAVDPMLQDLDEIVVKLLWGERGIAWEINRRQYASLLEVRAVLDAVAKVKPDLPVILDVASQVPLENVIDVYDLCRHLGLQKVQFAASAEAGA